MKPPILLKTILDILFYLLIFLGIAGTLVLIYNLIQPEAAIDFKLNGEPVTELNQQNILTILFALFFFSIFFACIYYLRKLVTNFSHNEIFAVKQEIFLSRLGYLLLIYFFAELVLGWVTAFLDSEEAGINFEIGVGIDGTFESSWFILILGLFFLYLSKVFENARKLKEENDFTV